MKKTQEINSNYLYQEHHIEPVWDENSKILILGTFPSVKSRQNQFFYGHPQNRFWRIIAKLYNSELPQTKEEKKALLLTNKIAIWDVIKSCEIKGSADSTIKNVIPNDINLLLENSHIEKIFVNGSKALKLYQKYLFPITKVEATLLPSTSPANAIYSIEKLCAVWDELINNNI